MKKNDLIRICTIVSVVVILLLIIIFTGFYFKKMRQESIAQNSGEGVMLNETSSQSGAANDSLAIFHVEDLSIIENKDEFRIEDYYIKNKVTYMNRYYIDENHTLWGYGNNEYGQLGNGQVDLKDSMKDPVQIADHVVTVDASFNGYFCVYLTTDGKLYGMGSNMLGLLGQEYEMTRDEREYTKVPTPILLMENVSYVRAGEEAIVALDRDGNVWWWGQYKTTISTLEWENADTMFWKAKEDDQNPVKMLSNHPKKILENCIFATTGNLTGAAIGQNGELYTWGLNIFGECGTEIKNGDFIRTPEKVMDNVRMVWPEKLSLGSLESDIPDDSAYNTSYPYNMFVQLKEGTILGAGFGLGNKEKQLAETDMLEYVSGVYSDSFIPIRLEQYSETANRNRLNDLQWGMSVEDTIKVLVKDGLKWTSFITEVQASESGLLSDQQKESIMLKSCDSIEVEGGLYYLYFEEEGRLNKILLQAGGSRNEKFTMGMSMEEIKALLGCDLICEDDNDENPVYRSKEPVGDSYYGFTFNDKTLCNVWEEQP